MLQLDDLISKGYFPRELIPALHSEGLRSVLPSVTANLSNLLQNRRTSKTCPFSIPRLKHVRRLLEIPNPLHQIRLSQTIVDNWKVIESSYSQSKIAIAQPKVVAGSLRAVVQQGEFLDTIFARILRSSPYHYLLKADISRFYHSIYTHSIPWALHTKATAKVNRRRGLIGNAIDEDIRNTRDGQTIGIPIGPDTSRIVSEIIVTAIDQSLETKLPYLTGVRYVDDLYLYFKTLADLDRGHSTLQNVLSDFELELNPEKVERTELPEVFESKWVIDQKFPDCHLGMSKVKRMYQIGPASKHNSAQTWPILANLACRGGKS